MLKLSDSEKKVLTIWAIIAILIFLIVLLFNFEKVKKEKEAILEITAKESNFVVDKDRYYTVKNAILKYYSYLNMKDYDAILKILDEEYIKENNITKDNLKDYINITDISLSYQSKRMCLKNAKKGVYTFVVEGKEIAQNSMDEFDDTYYEVTLDGNTFLFSLKVVSPDYFGGVCK